MPCRDRSIRLHVSDFATLMQRGNLSFKTGGDPVALLKQAREKGEVLVSESFALRFGVKEGSDITLDTPKGPQTFRIAALLYDYTNDRGTLTIDLPRFNSLFGAGAPTHMAIYLQPGMDPDQAREDILRLTGDKAQLMIFTNAGLRAEVLKIFDSTFAITWALEIIAVLVAMAVVAATMLTLVL